MIKPSSLLLSALLLAAPAFALEDTPENRLAEAQRYLAATPPQEMIADMADQMAKNIPAEKRQEFKNLMTKHLDLEAFSAAMISAMVKNFTADELSALADFYGSPLGKSAMKKFGAYMADMMPEVQSEMMKAVTRANQEKPNLLQP